MIEKTHKNLCQQAKDIHYNNKFVVKVEPNHVMETDCSVVHIKSEPGIYRN